jgi:hypothetical protein
MADKTESGQSIARDPKDGRDDHWIFQDARQQSPPNIQYGDYKGMAWIGRELSN